MSFLLKSQRNPIAVQITPQARNLPLPVISRRPSSKTIRRAACGVTSRVFATIPADTSGFANTSSTSSGSFEDVRRPYSFREHRTSCAPASVMLFHADLGRGDQAVSKGEQPGLPITMPAPIDENGFEAEIDGGEMGAGGDAGLP